MAKSVDLRTAAVKYHKSGFHTYAETAKVFGVGSSTIYAWVQKFERTGSLENKPLNRTFKKIDPERLRTYVREHPDDTQEEIAKAFGCCNQAISKAFKRLGITRKKRLVATKSRIQRK